MAAAKPQPSNAPARRLVGQLGAQPRIILLSKGAKLVVEDEVRPRVSVRLVRRAASVNCRPDRPPNRSRREHCDRRNSGVRTKASTGIPDVLWGNVGARPYEYA